MDGRNVRIFGLLGVAAVVSTLMYFGMSAAQLEGTVLGVEIKLAGPIAAFPSLVLIFWVTRLFTMGFDDLGSVDQPPGWMNRSAIQKELGDLKWKQGRITLRVESLEEMLKASEAKRDNKEVAEAGGLRAATRSKPAA